MMRLVVQQRHPEAFGEEPRVDGLGIVVETGQRDAEVALARAFGADVPARAAPELVGVNEEALENHDRARPQGGSAWASAD